MTHNTFGSYLVAALVGLALLTPAMTQAQATVDDRLLLDGAGVDAALLAQFVDGKPLDAAERPALVTVLGGLRQCSQWDLERYSRKPAAGKELAAVEARGRLWSLRGTLKSAVAESLSDAEVERIYAEVDVIPPDDPRRRAHRCEIELADGGPTVTVYTLAYPKALAGKEKLDEQVSLLGLCLKNAGTVDAAQPLIATRHLSWYPDTPLGKMGMDYTLYDDVRREAHDLKRERECFYQLLAAMKRADFAQLQELTNRKEPFSVVPLFNAPETMRGKLESLEGIARRAVAVIVNDPDIEARFGIRQYYEVAIYTADSQQNPLLFNLLELPPGFPQGETIRAHVRIPGTFLTGFYYHRDPTLEEQVQGIKPPLQKAPLLIGKTLYRFPEVDTTQSPNSWWFAAAIAAAVAVLAYVGWRATRTESRTRDLLQKQMAPPPGTSLNDAPVEYQAKPDFSGLDVPPPADDARS